jgi:hypothetical protein
MATPLLWTRQPDTIGVLGLALNSCYEPNGAGHAMQTEQIKELLIAARDLWRSLPEIDEEAEKLAAFRLTFRLVHLADIVAVTTRG